MQYLYIFLLTNPRVCLILPFVGKNNNEGETMNPQITEQMNGIADRLVTLRAERDRLQMVITNSTDPKIVRETIPVWKRYVARVDDAETGWNRAWLVQCETAARLTAAGV
jgi:hypothetical protein